MKTNFIIEEMYGCSERESSLKMPHLHLAKTIENVSLLKQFMLS